MLDSRLHHVVAVAKHGSFTAAANAVGVTQSAITKSIADLEKQIGYSIFYRTSKGSFLTPEGRDFVEQAARVLDDASELLQGPRRTSDVYAGPLRIGVGPASLEWRLIEPISLLMSRHKSIRFEVVASTYERTVQLLRNGAIDVALGLEAAFREWPDFRREEIPGVPSVMFVRKGHPILANENISLRDVVEYDHVSPSTAPPYGSTMRQIYEDAGVDWRQRIHIVDYFPLVKRIVSRSDAIGIVAEPYTHSSAFREKFVAIKQHDMPRMSTLCCAVRKKWDTKPAVRAFVRAVKDTAGVVSGK